MQLLNNPLMNYHGERDWPPAWLSRDRKQTTGEIGLLKYVAADVRLGPRCFLRIEHEGDGYIGSRHFDDHRFCALM